MIDRIKFEIKKVDQKYIVRKLKLKKDPYRDKTQPKIYRGKIDTLKVNYYERTGSLTIENSLHVFAKGNNYSQFTIEEARNTLLDLEKKVGIPLERFLVKNIEFGINMLMPKDPMEYINLIRGYDNRRFLPMTPYVSTVKGIHCVFDEYHIKFYDKTYETIKKKRIKVKDRKKIPKNILRFEVKIKKMTYAKSKKFHNMTGKTLLSGHHYIMFKRLLKEYLNEVHFLELSIDYKKMLPRDIKRYIFVLSDTYALYLDYLKEHKSEEDFRKENRSRNRFIKRIKPKLTGELEQELKDKFTETIISISKKESPVK